MIDITSLAGGTTIVLSNAQADASVIRAAVEPALTMASASLFAVISFMILCSILVIGAICLLSSLFKSRKSMAYRKLIADLYVVGMTKQFAAEDGIKIEEEHKIFEKYLKAIAKKSKKDNSIYDVDDAIEENLTDKIDAKTEQHLAELDKKNKKETKEAK